MKVGSPEYCEYMESTLKRASDTLLQLCESRDNLIERLEKAEAERDELQTIVNQLCASRDNLGELLSNAEAERDAALARLADIVTTLEARYDWSKMPLDDPLGLLLRQFDTDGVWIGEVEG